MNEQYVVRCDDKYISYDAFKNMTHKFKEVDNIDKATHFISKHSANDCIRSMVEYLDFKTIYLVEIKTILTVIK